MHATEGGTVRRGDSDTSRTCSVHEGGQPGFAAHVDLQRGVFHAARSTSSSRDPLHPLLFFPYPWFFVPPRAELEFGVRAAHSQASVAAQVHWQLRASSRDAPATTMPARRRPSCHLSLLTGTYFEHSWSGGAWRGRADNVFFSPKSRETHASLCADLYVTSRELRRSLSCAQVAPPRLRIIGWRVLPRLRNDMPPSAAAAGSITREYWWSAASKRDSP